MSSSMNLEDRLQSLPNDLILCLVDNLSICTLSNLARTTKTLHGIFNHHLYTVAVKAGHGLRIMQCGAMAGNVRTLDWAIQRGVDVDCTPPNRIDQPTPLHIAAVNAQPEAVRYLIDQGADVHTLGAFLRFYQPGCGHLTRYTPNRQAVLTPIENKAGILFGIAESQCYNPLMHAIITRDLIRRGLNVNQSNAYGITALHVGAGEWNYRYVETLLQIGADATSTDTRGFTPLHYATNPGQWVLQRPSDIESGIRTVRRLLQYGCDPNALSGSRYIAERLKESSPLNFAARMEAGSELVIELLRGGAHVDGGLAPVPPLYDACIGGSECVGTVCVLLAHGANPNKTKPPDDATPLMAAAIACNCVIMDALLERGAYINASSSSGKTALDLVLISWAKNVPFHATRRVFPESFRATAAFLRDRGGVRNVCVHCAEFNGKQFPADNDTKWWNPPGDWGVGEYIGEWISPATHPKAVVEKQAANR